MNSSNFILSAFTIIQFTVSFHISFFVVVRNADAWLVSLFAMLVICRDYKRKAAGLVICQFVPPLGRNSCIQVSVGKMMRPVGYNRGGGGGEGGGGGGKVLVGHVDCPHEVLG